MTKTKWTRYREEAEERKARAGRFSMYAGVVPTEHEDMSRLIEACDRIMELEAKLALKPIDTAELTDEERGLLDDEA